MKKNYYEEIDKAIKAYENYRPWTPKSIDWICDRINWCWKWRKITKAEMEELSNRIIKIMNEIKVINERRR